ncbi:MAG: replication-associated recombination protein A [bacterium]|nr:replication-associated recombination protein A [bacterium]
MPLFGRNPRSGIRAKSQPLAYKLAPENLDEYIGQNHILDIEKPLRLMIEQDKLLSIILWGPPGCGKTALSRLIAAKTSSHYIALNAVTAKISDIKNSIEQAKIDQYNNKRTIIFIDEIHRFNKIQQDALLPDVENGLLTFIGATTENPYFSVIPALISRAQVFELFPLSNKELKSVLNQAINKIKDSISIKIDEEAKSFLVAESHGDARKLINILEMAILTRKKNTQHNISLDLLTNLTLSKGLKYSEDDHYDIISAFIKSMRGSDPDAAVYWLARMLKGGEDPEFIARRLIIFASEDIGNADPTALIMATSLLEAVKFIGMPEIRINLSHVTTYLATAPKSNASYLAINNAYKLIDSGVVYPVPDHLRDSHYRGAKEMGFGNKYIYPHNYKHSLVNQQYIPENHNLYEPRETGHEKTIKKRIDYINSFKNNKNSEAQNFEG